MKENKEWERRRDFMKNFTERTNCIRNTEIKRWEECK